MSNLLRTAIDDVLGRDVAPSSSGAPRSLTLVQRRLLSMQHEILSQLRADDDAEVSYHRKMIEVLTRGFSGEYDSAFSTIEPELSRRECALVWDLLDMFRVLKSSLSQLDVDEVAAVGEHSKHALTFRGFDFNDSRESRLASYAKYLVEDDRWEELAEHFDATHEAGNSHAPMLATYERMLDVFKPIWQARKSDYSRGYGDRFVLNLDELKKVYAAWPYPRA